MKLFYILLLVIAFLLSREARLWQGLAIEGQRADAYSMSVALEIAKAMPKPPPTPPVQHFQKL